MPPLHKMKCLGCEGMTKALDATEIDRLADQVPQWAVVKNHHLQRDYPMKEFVDGLAFVNKIATIAEREGHHPDLALKYGSVGIVIYTHSVDGLTRDDFILAAKIDMIKPK